MKDEQTTPLNTAGTAANRPEEQIWRDYPIFRAEILGRYPKEAIIAHGGVLWRVRKTTNKDMVLRPLSKAEAQKLVKEQKGAG